MCTYVASLKDLRLCIGCGLHLVCASSERVHWFPISTDAHSKDKVGGAKTPIPKPKDFPTLATRRGRDVYCTTI